ncbi:response regulator [Chryseolinea sp. T2]|uniref:response regulator n=1 Tax=Chryseolinea sp. T2 TaxID=3129255 RepID=UPI003077227C
MRRNTLMIIDDDSDDVELFIEALLELDNTVVWWKELNSSRALARLLSNDVQNPEVIFLDINMPILSGWDVLGVLKDNPVTKHIPIIMCSTSSHEADMAKARRMGAACFLVKPNDYQVLTYFLKKILQSLKEGTIHNCDDFLPWKISLKNA